MIRMKPLEFNFAAALGAIRRRPPRSAGPANALRYHHLSYTGSPYLTFATADFRVSMVSRLPVEGEGEPWECRVSFHNFNAFAPEADGGVLTLNPGDPRCVRAEKWKSPDIDTQGRSFFFAYPLHRIQGTTPYPSHELVDVTRTAVVRLAPLRDALAFAAPVMAEQDQGTRVNTCTITPPGEVISYSERVFFRAVADSLGFEVNIPGPDAGRLGSWLTLIGLRPHAEVEVATGTDSQGRPCHQFRTPDHAHTFRVIAAPRPVPYEFVNQVRDEPAAVGGTVSGDQLFEVASFFRQFKGNPVELRFAEAGTGWQVSLTTIGDCPAGGGVLTLSDSQIPDGVAARQPLLVSPGHLRQGLMRQRARRLHLTYRPKSRTITLTDDVPTPRRQPAGHQSFLRVTTVSAHADEV